MNLWDIGKHVDGVKVDQIWICEQVPGSFSGKVLHVALEGGILAARVSAVIRRCFVQIRVPSGRNLCNIYRKFS